MSFTILPAQASDLEAVLHLAHRSPEVPAWPATAWAAYLEPAAGPPLLRCLLIAVYEGSVCGFAAATFLLDSPPTPGGSCELDSIAVDPGMRRQGVGRALLRALQNWAARHGADRLTLEVRSANAPALALYGQAGFTIEGRRPGYYSHPPDDALLLHKAVTSVIKNPLDFHHKSL